MKSTGFAGNERHFYIDALRVIAVLLMFVFHVSMIFVAESGWHIKNTEQSSVLLEVNTFLSFFRMPLLFFVSGYISAMLLTRLSWKEFLNQRFQRLIIPLLLWTFILVAPQIYFERKLSGYDSSYLEFYKTFLQFEWYPDGNFHWLHLWFIPYLFVYNLLLIPFFLFFKKPIFFTPSLEKKHSGLIFIFSYIFIASLPYAFLTIKLPASYDLIHDYARHSFYFPFVVAGLVFFRFNGFVQLIEKNLTSILRYAFLITLFIFTLEWNDWDPSHVWGNWIEMPQTYLYFILLNSNSWLWVLACLGYGKRYLNKESAFFKYANQAVYPFYILHQTVIVVIGYYVVQTSDNVAFKYLFILIVCFCLCAFIYHLFIRPFPLIRYLFGSK
ncbi:MAG: acyltransferase family protein [Pseudomonadota bacterium]